MGKRKVVNKIEAYSGMYINHNRNTYQLVQTDTSQKYCMCRQGYILRKVVL